jgi:ferredoxin-NADP reductase
MKPSIMEEHIVRIFSIEYVTHDVRRYKVEKPAGYTFIPGQATEVSINSPKWKEEKRPFTFTCLTTDPFLEFTIKSYASHKGVTNEIYQLEEGAELIIRDVWGAIAYTKPGVFIAAGAGITPFIAIFRHLSKLELIAGNSLIYANKTSKDIILQDELKTMLGDQFTNTLSREKNELYDNRRIDKAYLMEKITNFNQPFYVCGPDQFVTDIHQILLDLGATVDTVIIEK